MSNSVNIVSGVTGQDGSYMVELIYETDPNGLIFGLARSSGTNRDMGSLSRRDFEVPFYVSDGNTSNLMKAYSEGIRFFVLACDLSSEDSVKRAFEEIKGFLKKAQIPNVFGLNKKSLSLYPMKFYCYHFGALSHVHESYSDPELYLRTNSLGSLYMYRAFSDLYKRLDLQMMKENAGFFYHAATTELFSGRPETVPQSSKTPFEPRTPYAVSKLSAFYLLKFEHGNTKGNYNLFLRQGILGNHESPRRPAKFVTKKIVEAVARFLRTGEKTQLGNPAAERDWGYAKDYMVAIRKMMVPEAPEVVTIGTGIKHSVEQFVDKTIQVYSERLNIKLNKDAIFEFANPKYMRVQEVDSLCIDISEALNGIGWVYEYTIDDLIELMVKDIIDSWRIKQGE